MLKHTTHDSMVLSVKYSRLQMCTEVTNTDEVLQVLQVWSITLHWNILPMIVWYLALSTQGYKYVHSLHLLMK